MRNQAITLTELVVASAVMGIAMLGVVALDYAMRSANNSADIHQRSASMVTTAIYRVRIIAAQTIGKRYLASSGTSQPLAEGIFVEDINNVNKEICFRIRNGNDVMLFTADDVWECFQQKLSQSRRLYACSFTGLTPELAVPDCTTLETNAVMHLSTDGFFNVVRDDPADSDSPIKYIELFFSYRPRTDLTDFDPINNPQYTLTTRVHPPMLSQ